MTGTLTVRITKSAGEIPDLRYRLIWSAHLDDRLLGQGHAFKEEQAVAQAQDLVAPDGIAHVVVDYRGR